MESRVQRFGYQSAQPTLYPYLDDLINALQTELELAYPVLAYATLETVSIQGTPTICLVAEDTTILDGIQSARRLQNIRVQQVWTILIVLRDAGDQQITTPLLRELGEWQANVLRILGRQAIPSGGPLNLIDCPKPEAIAGGAIAGRIRFQCQFVLNLE